MLRNIAATFVVGVVLRLLAYVPAAAMSPGGLGQQADMGLFPDSWVAASGAVWAATALAAVWGAAAVVWAISTGNARLRRWHVRRSLRRLAPVR